MATYPVVRISKGRFAPELYDKVHQIAQESAKPLIPAIRRLRGLLYYSAGVDPVTNTIVNISIWTDLAAAQQMSTLPEMLAQRPIMEEAGVQFDAIANYEPLWVIQDTEPRSIFSPTSPSQE
jgi:quinol monooxygenase YgiN